MYLERYTMLSERKTALGLGNKGLFTLTFIIPKKNGMIHFIMNLKPLNHYYLLKIQNDHPEADHRGHSATAVGSLTGHQVSMQSYPKEILLLSLPQDLSSLSVQSLKDFYENDETHLVLLSKDGHDPVPYLDDALLLVDSNVQARMLGQKVALIL